MDINIDNNTESLNEGNNEVNEVNGNEVNVAQKPNEGPPETIPYERFKEVNDKYREVESRLEFQNQALNQVLANLSTNQTTQSYTDQSEVQTDIYDQIANGLMEGDKNSLSQLTQIITRQVAQQMAAQQQAQSLRQQAFNQIGNEFPVVNDPDIQSVILQKGQQIVNQHYAAGKAISDMDALRAAAQHYQNLFVPKGHEQNKQEAKANAFVENSGNQLPNKSPSDPLKQAAESGNLVDMFAAHLENLKGK